MQSRIYILPFLAGALLISACGSEFTCSQSFAASEKRYFGPYEEAKCRAGENVLSAKLEYQPGGLPIRLVVECSKVAVICK